MGEWGEEWSNKRGEEWSEEWKSSREVQSLPRSININISTKINNISINITSSPLSM